LPGKTTEHYVESFKAIDSYGPFEPETIMCDFERAIHAAIRQVWPSCTIDCRYFHFKKSIWARLSSLGFSEEYKVLGSDVSTWFKKVGAMPFVHLGDVEDAWEVLRSDYPADLVEFADYFESTWVSGRNNFDHYIWNKHDTVLAGLPRSNNAVEGWHNGFQQLVGHSNPTIWNFLNANEKRP